MYICTCRATGDKDVAFKVLYCGICHSDLHMVKIEWGFCVYPRVGLDQGALVGFSLDRTSCFCIGGDQSLPVWSPPREGNMKFIVVGVGNDVLPAVEGLCIAAVRSCCLLSVYGEVLQTNWQ
ncbi:hypothetical protein V6N13_044649 [Hibiscus sabdariffa]